MDNLMGMVGSMFGGGDLSEHLFVKIEEYSPNMAEGLRVIFADGKVSVDDIQLVVGEYISTPEMQAKLSGVLAQAWADGKVDASDLRLLPELLSAVQGGDAADETTIA